MLDTDTAGTDQAHVPVTKLGQDFFYGMVSGKNIPTDVVEYAYIEPHEAGAWLSQQGYSRIPDTSPPVEQ